MAKSLPSNIAAIFVGYGQGRVLPSAGIGYFVLGYSLTKMKHLKIKSWPTFLIMILLFEVNIMISFTTLYRGHLFLNIISLLNVPILATLIFIWLRSFEGMYQNWFIRIIEFIAPLTYGVYMIHGIAIELVQKVIGTNHYVEIFVLASIVSITTMFVVSKIPFLKKVLL